MATKFFEHFLYIAHAANNLGGEGLSLWNDDDGFFYDVLRIGDQSTPLKVRSFVGLIPLFAVETIEPRVFEVLPDFADRVKWFQKNRPDLCANIFTMNRPGVGERRLMSLVGPDRLRRILARMLDEREFLSANGLRSLSKVHETHPVSLMLGGHDYSVGYQPGESTTGMFGGNSNWRGPVWFPVNYLMIESLQRFHHYLGPEFTVEMPTGSGEFADLSASPPSCRAGSSRCS